MDLSLIMDKQEVILTVARYVVDDTKTLRGMLGAEHVFQIGGCSTGESSCSGYEIFRGYGVDILAESIENKNFFGWYIPDEPEQACNSGNAKLVPLRPTKEGTDIRVREFIETEGGLLVKVPLVRAKPHLNCLKTPEEFKKYSELVDLTSQFGKHKKTPKEIKRAIDILFA